MLPTINLPLKPSSLSSAQADVIMFQQGKMKLLPSLLLSLLLPLTTLGACELDTTEFDSDDSSEDRSEQSNRSERFKYKNRSPAGNKLTIQNLTTQCDAYTGHMDDLGGLSAVLYQGTMREKQLQCSVSGTIIVPKDVKLTFVSGYLRGDLHDPREYSDTPVPNLMAYATASFQLGDLRIGHINHTQEITEVKDTEELFGMEIVANASQAFERKCSAKQECRINFSFSNKIQSSRVNFLSIDSIDLGFSAEYRQ